MSVHPDEKEIIDIIDKHLKKYNALTMSISMIQKLEIEKDICNCLKDLVNIYLDETKSRQIFKKIDNTIIYESLKSTLNYNKKLIALTYVSYIVDMILFYYTHCEIYDIKFSTKNIIKHGITPNTITFQNSNNLSSLFTDYNGFLTPTRIYSDDVITDFQNGGFMNHIRVLQNTLQQNFTDFCNDFIILLEKKYPTFTSQQIKDTFYSSDNINFNSSDPLSIYNNIYDNWIDRLINLITNNTTDNDILKQTEKEIERLIIKNLEDLNTKYYQYITDGYGFFALKYLKYLPNPTLSGCCLPFTLIEHYVLHRLYFEPSRIKLIIQCVGCRNQNLYGTNHPFYTYTQESIYNNLLYYKNIRAISHWFTNFSDISYYKIDNIKLLMEKNDITLHNKFKNNKLVGPLLRNVPNYHQNPILKPLSLTNDTADYFKLFIYPIIDAQIHYVVLNTKNIMDIQKSLHVSTNPRYDKFIIYPIKTVSKLGSTIYETLENELKSFDKNNRNNPIKSISNNLEYLFDDTQDMSGNEVERKQTRTNINKINNFEVDDIVNNILHSDVNLRFNFQLNQNPSLYFDRKPNEIIDDSDTFLKDIMTKFVNNHFYNNNEITFNFFNVIQTIFKNGIDKYIQKRGLPENCIIFVFKGGNIMRLLINKELETNFSEKQMIIILDKVKDIFKKSDSDFQIYVKNLINSVDKNGIRITKIIMDEIYNDINKLTYLLLNRIRNIILLNPEQYINFMQNTDDYKSTLFTDILNTINKEKEDSEKYKDVTFTSIRFENIVVGDDELDKYPYIITDKKDMSTIFTYHNKNSRGDMLLYVHEPQPNETPLDAGNTRVAISINDYLYNSGKYDDLYDKLIEKNLIYNNRANTNFYISYNNSIEMHKGIIDIKFNLLRIKINFSLTYKKLHKNGKTYTYLINIPGEYIDVSLPHYTNMDTEYIFKHIDDTDLPITQYNINLSDKLLLNINGYSYTYFIKDLETVLFYQNQPPWNDNKYEKRILRILILYFVELVKNIKTIEQQQMYIKFLGELRYIIASNIIECRFHQQTIQDKSKCVLEDNFINFKTAIQELFTNKYYADVDDKLLYVKFFKYILVSSKEDNTYKSKYTGMAIDGINIGILQNIPTDENEQLKYYKEFDSFYRTIMNNISIHKYILENMFKINYVNVKEFTKIAGGYKNKKK